MTRNRITFTILLLGSLLWGQDVTIEPIFFGMHRTTGGLWQPEAEPVSFAGWGIRGSAGFGDWQLDADLVLTRFFGMTGLPNRFAPEQGFSWQQHSTGTIEEFDTDYSSMKLAYQAGGFTALLGKFSQSWGPGLQSLTISNKPPTYPQFGFDWQINDHFRYTYVHGSLFSGLEGQVSAADSSLVGSRRIYLDRYIAAHRLEWRPLNSVTLGVLESVVYGGRGIEMIYLMPFISLWSAEHYLGDTDNVQMSADITWRPGSNIRLYGVFLMDEWHPQSTFKENNRNWFAWQGGIELQSIISDDDCMIAEATWTDHRIIRHRFPINDFTSHGYPVGPWIGPHAQSLYISYLLPRWGSRIMISYLYAKRGELTDEMLTEQYNTIPYERFSGYTETIKSLDLIIARPVWKKLWWEIEIGHIRWLNAGFDPADPQSDSLEDVKKTSFNIGFYYNFSLPGYPITLLQSR